MKTKCIHCGKDVELYITNNVSIDTVRDNAVILKANFKGICCGTTYTRHKYKAVEFDER